MKKSPAAVLSLPFVATLLLVGCGGDGKSDASPSSTTISSSTKTTAPTTPSNPPTTTASAKLPDPAIPSAARAHTTAGAEAFVRYFIERVNLAWTEPRAGILSPLCEASVKACAAYERDATRLSMEGHRYDGNPVSITFVGTLDATNPRRFEVLANLVQERRSEIDAAGKVYVTDQRKNVRLNFEVVHDGHAWTVSSLKLMK